MTSKRDELANAYGLEQAESTGYEKTQIGWNDAYQEALGGFETGWKACLKTFGRRIKLPTMSECLADAKIFRKEIMTSDDCHVDNYHFATREVFFAHGKLEGIKEAAIRIAELENTCEELYSELRAIGEDRAARHYSESAAKKIILCALSYIAALRGSGYAVHVHMLGEEWEGLMKSEFMARLLKEKTNESK